jgi:hypothetical protein
MKTRRSRRRAARRRANHHARRRDVLRRRSLSLISAERARRSRGARPAWLPAWRSPSPPRGLRPSARRCRCRHRRRRPRVRLRSRTGCATRKRPRPCRRRPAARHAHAPRSVRYRSARVLQTGLDRVAREVEAGLGRAAISTHCWYRASPARSSSSSMPSAAKPARVQLSSDCSQDSDSKQATAASR